MSWYRFFYSAIFRSLLPLVCLGFSFIPAMATTTLEFSNQFSGDNNVYSYIIPYQDTYSSADVKFNFKDKFRRSTHFSLGYSTNMTSYYALPEKDSINKKVSFSLEEDLTDSMIGIASVSANMYDYRNATNSLYDYYLLSSSAAVRFYFFQFDFTKIDCGTEYSIYTLPNYNFEVDGYTPSLSFLEEVAEYNALGAFLTINQSLGKSMEIELTGKLVSKYCPERPLFESVSTGSYPDYNHHYLDDKRSDLESTFAIVLNKRFQKSSYIKLSYCITGTQSNANAQAYDASIMGDRLFDSYYNMGKGRAILDAMYTFGQEYSYVRLYATYTNIAYDNRNAQDNTGGFYSDPRKDEEVSILVECNQRLGYIGKSSWNLRLAYQFTQNLTNDYYYNFKREIISLGLSAAIYL